MIVQYFGRHLQTVNRIDANDTPLESYEKSATLLSQAFFEIPYGLGAVLNIHNSVFLKFSLF